MRQLIGANGIPDANRLSKAVPRRFLTVNDITRAEVQAALASAVSEMQGVDGEQATAQLVEINGVNNHVLIGRGPLVKKDVHITNQGQFAGNIDSTNSHVSVERQQQVLTPAQEDALRKLANTPEIQHALALDVSEEEKTTIVGGRLAKLAGVASDVATTFAAKLIAEMSKH